MNPSDQSTQSGPSRFRIEQGGTSSHRLRLLWIVPAALGLATSSIILTAWSAEAAPPPVTGPPLTWSPDSVQVILSPGESISRDLIFTSSKTLTNVTLSPVPELAPFITISPSQFAQVLANVGQTIRVTFTIAPTAGLGTYQGAIQLMVGPQTLPKTLKVGVTNIAWTQQFPTLSPPSRLLGAAAYDEGRGQLVLFGGIIPGGTSGTLNDTWVWDGTNWSQQFPAVSPPRMALPTMAYDPVLGEIVLFGLTSSDGFTFLPPAQTWVWNGLTWAQRFPLTTPPLFDSAMVYDAARSKILLFGGTAVSCACPSNQTWTWDGSNWSQEFPLTSPPPRFSHALSYDSVREEVVLFGGFGGTYYSDTWVWDGINWVQRFPASSPPSREFHKMAYDPALNRVVMFGGERFDLGQYFGDTWVWDGSTWTQLLMANAPSARSGHVMVYDTIRLQMVLFGSTRPSALNDTWLLETSR